MFTNNLRQTHEPPGGRETTPSPVSRFSVPHPWALVILALICLMSFHFRTHRLDESPGWFVDEGLYFEVTQRLGRAELQMGAVNVTFVGPYMTHPPLYFGLAHFFLSLFGDDMHHFRMFNALLGVLATLLCFLLGMEAERRMTGDEEGRRRGEFLGLLAAFFFAIHPDAVMYNRMGLPYNLYMIQVILTSLFALLYLRKRTFSWLLAACLTAASALITVYYAIAIIPFLLAVTLAVGKKHHLWALAVIPIPLVLFLGLMGLSHTPGFLEDWRAMRGAAASGSLYNLLSHYADFFQTGLSYIAGLAGLLLIRRKKAGLLIFLLAFLLLHIVLRKADTIIRFIHYPVIPLLPLVAVGCAALTLYFKDKILEGSPAGLFLIAVVLASWLALGQTRHGVHGRFVTTMEFGVSRNLQDTMQMGRFAASQVSQDDLVLASPTLWSLLPCHKADLAQSAAWNGEKASFYQYHFPPERFLFSPSLEHARLVILDHFTTQVEAAKDDDPIHGPVSRRIRKVRADWKRIYHLGEYEIFLNPAMEAHSP